MWPILLVMKRPNAGIERVDRGAFVNQRAVNFLDGAIIMKLDTCT